MVSCHNPLLQCSEQLCGAVALAVCQVMLKFTSVLLPNNSPLELPFSSLRMLGTRPDH
ncbi:unnamed protein product [Ixodes persulcatus]